MPEDENGQESLTDEELELEESDSGDADDTGGEDGDADKGPIPYDRFQKVARERREAKELAGKYGEFGSPEEIAESLARLKAYERMTEEEREEVPKADEAELEAIAKIRKELLKVFPGLERLDEFAGMADQYYEGLATEAWDVTEALMRAQGMERITDDEIRGMSNILIEIVGSDRKLRAKYNVGHVETAVKGAFKKLQGKIGKTDDKLSEDARKAAAKRKLKRLPKTHEPGSTPVGAADDDTGPKSWKEAEAAAMKRLG